MGDTTCLAGWCGDEDWCAVTCAAEVIGKKWHPVIIHRLLASGPLGFNGLEDAIDGISSNVLSNSLDRLEEDDIVDRKIANEKPFRVAYSLTERGHELRPVIEAMNDWGKTYESRS